MGEAAVRWVEAQANEYTRGRDHIFAIHRRQSILSIAPRETSQSLWRVLGRM